MSRTGLVNPRLLPSASETLATLFDLLQRTSIRDDLAATALEVAAGVNQSSSGWSARRQSMRPAP
jgi:hypothetical protein